MWSSIQLGEATNNENCVSEQRLQCNGILSKVPLISNGATLTLTIDFSIPKHNPMKVFKLDSVV